MASTGKDKKIPEIDPNDQLNEILFSMKRIEAELERVNSHRLVKVYNSISQLLLFHFLKGIAFGLGSVLGATIIVSILAYVLSQFEFVPILGEWVKLIVQEIQK